MADVIFVADYRSKHEFSAHALREPGNVQLQRFTVDPETGTFAEISQKYETFWVKNPRRTWVAEIIRYEDGDVKVY